MFPSFLKQLFAFFLIFTLQVHVEALGYVGFGISPNGGMTGADVVIGWVKDDGTAVFHVCDLIRTTKNDVVIRTLSRSLILQISISLDFQDRHALGEYEPIIDESQDVTLLAANLNDTHTILRFSRPYVTCDENDRDITVCIRSYSMQVGNRHN